MKPLIYFSAGLNRSASTWLYNAMRLMLEAKYPGEVYGSLPGIYRPDDLRRIHLIKIHQRTEGAGMEPVFTATSHRNLIDVFRSLYRMGWAKMADVEAVRLMDNIVADHEHWSARADYEFAYEDFVAEPMGVLHSLHAGMKLGLRDGDLARILSELKEISSQEIVLAEGDVFHPLTFLHRKHISRPGEAQPQIPTAIEYLLMKRYADWLKSHGYEAAV